MKREIDTRWEGDQSDKRRIREVEKEEKKLERKKKYKKPGSPEAKRNGIE